MSIMKRIRAAAMTAVIALTACSLTGCKRGVSEVELKSIIADMNKSSNNDNYGNNADNNNYGNNGGNNYNDNNVENNEDHYPGNAAAGNHPYEESSIVSFFKKLPEKLKAVGDTVLTGLGSENGSAPTAFGDVEKMCAKLISKFESDLTTQYPTLTLLADKGENKPKVQFKVAESWNTDLTANESLKNYVTADDEKDERASLAGCGGCAAAGAVIGSIIPGLGTVLGGGLGFVVGAIAMSKRSESPKRAKKLREKTAGDYAAIKFRFFEELKIDLTNAMRKHSNACRSAIADTAHEYLDFYKDVVRELTERNKAERLAAEQCIKEIDEDVRRLRTFSEETENILKHLGKENRQ